MIHLIKYLVTFGIFLCSMGCVSKGPQVGTPILIPPPPEVPRLQYLTDITTSHDIEKPNRLMEFLTGEREPPIPLVKPYGITSTPGKLYIADTMSGGINMIDFEESTFTFWAARGNGGFRKPHGIAVAPDGTRYVADSIQGEILIYNAEGKYLAAFGSAETMKPTDVEVWKDKLYVANLKQKRIEVYDRGSRALLMTIPGDGAGEDASERLFSPTNVDVDEEGRIYVSDTGGFFVKVFNQDGTLARNFGSIGAHYGGMVRPKGIAADREGRVYVADAATAVIQIFNEEDKLLLFFGKVQDPMRSLVLPAGLHIDYDNAEYFAPYVAPGFEVEYLLFIADQYGPKRLKVYGFIQPKQGVGLSAATDDGSDKT